MLTTIRHDMLRKAVAALLLCLPIAVQADPLDEEQAREAAAAFFAPTTNRSRVKAQARELRLRSRGHEAGFYVFDRPGGGFVFVADDDGVGRTVLGYSEQGTFQPDSLPTALREWMQQVGVLMDAVHAGNLHRQPTKDQERQVVVNALIKTTWNQKEPYFNSCPMVNGQHCLTGCVATAMAQVMNYWKWPEHGYGSIYYLDEGCGQWLGQDFSGHYYEWDNMRNSYSLNYTEAQATAVATLMRDCGYAVQMNYTLTASGSNLQASVLRRFFRYSGEARTRTAGHCSEELWADFLEQDLRAGRPVLYSGTNSEGGHQFIIDGFQTGGYYHVNWGWGGNSDGWFSLTNLGNYNNDQTMINGVEPDRTDASTFDYTLFDDGTLTITGQGPMPGSFAADEAPWKNDFEHIQKVVIAPGITSVTNGFGCTVDFKMPFENLKEVTLPDGLTCLGEYAFANAPLQSVDLPSTLVSMDYAFYNCRELTTLHLPRSLVSFRDYLPSLSTLTIDDGNAQMKAESNILYTKDMRQLLHAPKALEAIHVAASTEKILDTDIFLQGTTVVFHGRQAPILPKVLRQAPKIYCADYGFLFFPAGATGYDGWSQILPEGWYTLSYTDTAHLPSNEISWKLQDGTLTISGWNSMKESIYGYVSAPYYSKADNITKVVVEEGVSGLCWAAFWGYVNLTEVELPSTLNYVGSTCFGYTPLSSITCRALQAPRLSYNAFNYLPTTGILRVPEGSDYSSWVEALPNGWTVEYFDVEPFATAYLSTGELQPVSDMKAWQKLLQQQPNAMAVAAEHNHPWAYWTSNMLLKNGDEYRCPYLQLRDLKQGTTTVEYARQTGFRPPVAFTAEQGEYVRSFMQGYNTLCLPFDLDASQLPEGAAMYSYSHFDTDHGDVVFKPLNRTPAGEACFIDCDDETTLRLDLAGLTVDVAEASTAASSAMRGTFVTTDAYAAIGYAPRRDNILAPLARELYPFRACLLIDTAASEEVRVRIADAPTDYLIAPQTEPSATTPAAFSLDGRRITTPRQGQPYIVNGKIVIR